MMFVSAAAKLSRLAEQRIGALLGRAAHVQVQRIADAESGANAA